MIDPTTHRTMSERSTSELRPAPLELEDAMTDEYGCIFPRGSVGLKGNFYIRENIIDMTYKLDQRRTAFVMAGTVQHICGDLTKETKQYL